MQEQYQWVSGISAIQWNGMVEWNGGMDYWNGLGQDLFACM